MHEGPCRNERTGALPKDSNRRARLPSAECTAGIFDTKALVTSTPTFLGRALKPRTAEVARKKMSHHAGKKFPLAAPAILATLLMTVGAVSFSPASADTPTYSGSAIVLSISSLLASQSFGAATLASSGGWSSAPMSEVQTYLPARTC